MGVVGVPQCLVAHVPGQRTRDRSVVGADGSELYLDERLGEPEELVVEAKGRRRKHVHAYWDGCAYVV